jgi:hypothetical protein
MGVNSMGAKGDEDDFREPKNLANFGFLKKYHPECV